MQNWQIIIVAVALVTAYLVEPRLFAILAGVSAATWVVAWFHLRSQERRGALDGFRRAVRSALALPENDDDVWPVETRRAGRPVTLDVVARHDARGSLTAGLLVRAPVARQVPFCFIGQLRQPPLRLPPLVTNAAVFDTPIECEMSEAEPPPGVGERYEMMSSSASVVRALLTAEIGPTLDALLSLENADVVTFDFDGAAVKLLLIPSAADSEAADDNAWIASLPDLMAALAATLEQGLDRVGGAPTGPPRVGPTGV